VGITIEKSEEVGSGEVGDLGACPQKKKIYFALKLRNSEQVLVLLSYITA